MEPISWESVMKYFLTAFMLLSSVVSFADDPPRPSPRVFDDGIRYECDVLSSQVATMQLTEIAIKKGIIKEGQVASAWEKERKHFFGLNTETSQVEQIQVKSYQFNNHDVKVSVTCAGISGQPKSAHITDLEAYSDFYDFDRVIKYYCRALENKTEIEIETVNGNLGSVTINKGKDIASNCNLTNRLLKCKTKKLEIDFSNLIDVPPSFGDGFWSILFGNRPRVRQAYKGSISTEFLGSSLSEVMCF